MKQEDQVRELVPKMIERPPKDAAKLLTSFQPAIIVSVLELLNPGVRQKILGCFEEDALQKVLAAVTPENREQWRINATFP
ncbi:MAG: hypothetical protein ABJC04_14225, partial [Verrucomicrobiota bacterium]